MHEQVLYSVRGNKHSYEHVLVRYEEVLVMQVLLIPDCTSLVLSRSRNNDHTQIWTICTRQSESFDTFPFWISHTVEFINSI